MENKVNRVEWIDIAKGIAIIFMVMGHTSIPSFLSKYIWSFHMPLFFFMSGLMYNQQRYNNFSTLLKKRMRTLFVPYWIFTIIVFIGYTGTTYQNAEELYLGWKGYALWFMPVLFFSNLLFYYIAKLRSNLKLILLACLTASFGYILFLCGVHLPFKIEVVPFALFFLIIGYCIKDKAMTFKPNCWICAIIGIITIGLSQVLPKLDMCENYYGIFGINLLNALLGIVFISIISYYIANVFGKYSRPLKWAGENSLFIMAFSQVFNYWILVSLEKLPIPHIVALPLRYCLLFGTIYLVSSVIKKYLPFVIGRR